MVNFLLLILSETLFIVLFVTILVYLRKCVLLSNMKMLLTFGLGIVVLLLYISILLLLIVCSLAPDQFWIANETFIYCNSKS